MPKLWLFCILILCLRCSFTADLVPRARFVNCPYPVTDAVLESIREIANFAPLGYGLSRTPPREGYGRDLFEEYSSNYTHFRSDAHHIFKRVSGEALLSLRRVPGLSERYRHLNITCQDVNRRCRGRGYLAYQARRSRHRLDERIVIVCITKVHTAKDTAF